ncbi:hypothetical protein SAMN04489844_1857 [Nocardioides exalbidus]|uniref:DUF642 domain-containing protein n=1 Tax=Nocardioides exalbidus TaxID=402596 RepID=A0A1H4QJ81_9ACTN|nr:hypothetical protein [Nocardioides exalbidus]SEC19604.1 hypothetical protein SAMN04489844_1857 [Nocardioides exalbidus]
MEALRPSRRAIARSAVWTVPVIAVAATAPAFAASPCDCAGFSVPAFPASGTLGNGWSLSSNNVSSGGGTDRFENGSFVTVEDSTRYDTRTVTASRSICVTAGKTYRFQYSWTAYLINNRKMTSVLQVNGQAVANSQIDTSTSQASGTRNVTWMSNASGTVTMSFLHTVTPPGLLGGNLTGDDITINSVTASCS